MEALKRRNRNKQVAKPLKLYDYLRQGKDDRQSVDAFTIALRNHIMTKVHNRTVKAKIIVKDKTAEEKHEKFTKQIVGLRRGKQYDFVKIENPEADENAANKHKMKEKSIQ